MPKVPAIDEKCGIDFNSLPSMTWIIIILNKGNVR